MNLKSKTSETIERGKAERGNFAPKPGSAPARLYNYWLENTKSLKGRLIRNESQRENFCHFWRVVVFWAPFMGFRRGAVRVLAAPSVQISLVALALVLLTIGFVIFDGFLVGLLQGLAILAAITAGILALALALVGICLGLRKYTPKFWKRLDEFGQGPGPFFITPVMLLIFWFVNTVVIYGAEALAWWALASVIVAAIGYGIKVWVDHSAGKEAIRKAEWDALSIHDQLAVLEYRAATRKREPGKIAKFFTGVGEFFVLIAQIVRVNKWKICPLVEVPKN